MQSKSLYRSKAIKVYSLKEKIGGETRAPESLIHSF